MSTGRTLNGITSQNSLFGAVLVKTNNLSDLLDKNLALNNLGLTGNIPSVYKSGSSNATPNTLVAYDNSGGVSTNFIKPSSGILHIKSAGANAILISPTIETTEMVFYTIEVVDGISTLTTTSSLYYDSANNNINFSFGNGWRINTRNISRGFSLINSRT
jgi:hypothetical protein